MEINSKSPEKQEMTIGIAVFDRLIKMLLMRIDRLEAMLNTSKRVFQPIPVVIKGKEYFDVYALTEIFKVTKHTIYRWRDEEKLPLVKIGGKYYIGVEELQAAMVANHITEPVR